MHSRYQLFKVNGKAKFLGLITQIALNSFGNGDAICRVCVSEGIALGSQIIALSIITLSMDSSHAQLTISAINNTHNQFDATLKVRNTSKLIGRNFLQSVLIHANFRVLRQGNSNVASNALSCCGACLKRSTSDCAQLRCRSCIAALDYTITNLRQSKSLFCIATIAFQLIDLFTVTVCASEYSLPSSVMVDPVANAAVAPTVSIMAAARTPAKNFFSFIVIPP